MANLEDYRIIVNVINNCYVPIVLCNVLGKTNMYLKKLYKELIENTKNVRLGLCFPSSITKDFDFVSVSLCHVVFPISNVNIYTTYNYSLHV